MVHNALSWYVDVEPMLSIQYVNNFSVVMS